MQFIFSQEILQIFFGFDGLNSLDNGQVIDEEFDYFYEIVAELVGGECCVYFRNIALQAADDCFDVAGVESEDVDQIFVEGILIAFLDYFVDLGAKIGKILEEGALADEFLVLEAGDLSNLVDEVDDGKRHLDDVDLEFMEHPLEFSNTHGQQINTLHFGFILFICQSLDMDIFFDGDVAFAEISQQNEGVLHVDQF